LSSQSFERFGALAARALAIAGHTVYASMRETTDRNAVHVEAARQFATENGVDLRTIELDVASQESATRPSKRSPRKTAVSTLSSITRDTYMVFGAAEAFTPEQLLEVYDANVLSTQRVNRAALPRLRKQKKGLVLWVGSTSTRGGMPPYLSPYFAAKAARKMRQFGHRWPGDAIFFFGELQGTLMITLLEKSG
jgi:NAD(P)-dependent dehydrogenase (short-subunit alcohol dehydrogenase family)